MSSKLARPKRAAEDYTRSHHDSDFSGQPSKKPRFDVRNPSALAPDELEKDETLEADVIGKRGQQVRRGAVNVDGYDSDSDNENFNARAEAKAKGQEKPNKSKDEDENDMFADLAEDFKDGDESEGETSRRDGMKKGVRFLDDDEIEGQVRNSKSGGHVSADFTLDSKGKGKKAGVDAEVESSSEEEVDDETRASAGNVDEELGAGSKKLHAPKLDAFNMQNENEEGRFDDQGNYVRKAVDPDAIHDLWMEGVSKKEMRRAKEAHEKREQDRRQRDLQDDAKSTGEVLGAIISLLESSETTLEALARLGKGQSKKQKPKWQKNKRKQDDVDVDTEMGDSDPAEAKRKEAIETITAAADILLTRGQSEVYDTERELLIRQYRKATGEDWSDSRENPHQESVDEVPTAKEWEYRWSDARDGGEIHGPYDGITMKAWNEAGYFGEGVEFRQKDVDGDWSRLVDFI